MNFKKIDFFSPGIVALVIILFLIVGYIGSFNYRFDSPLSIKAILIIIYSLIVFLVGSIIINYMVTIKSPEKDLKIAKILDRVLSEKLLLVFIIIAIALQGINLLLLGGIPLFNSVLKSNATTNLWRVSYLLFLPCINILMAKYYKKRYFILILVGTILFALNGYRTSILGILISLFISLYYIKKINIKLGIIFISIIIIGAMAIGFIASQSIVNQNWVLNPLELVFYRCGFTLKVFDKIIPLAGTTNGHTLSMIFSSGSPRTFIGEYVLHYDVCLTSTIFGPVMLDFGLIGLTIQMLFMGAFLKLISKIKEYKKGISIGIYSIILAHTLIWIETGPTDIMIWILYLLGLILIVLNYNYLAIRS